MVWRETLASAGVAASFGSYYRMTVGAADLAFAYFGFDDLDGIAAVNHGGDVVLFVGQVVELKDAWVCYAAVCAFAVEAFVAVYECSIAVTLVFVLCYASMAVRGVPRG